MLMEQLCWAMVGSPVCCASASPTVASQEPVDSSQSYPESHPSAKQPYKLDDVDVPATLTQEGQWHPAGSAAGSAGSAAVLPSFVHSLHYAVTALLSYVAHQQLSAPCHPLHEPHRGVTLSGFAVALVAGLTPAGKAACRLALITDGPPVINASVPSGTRILRFITAT